MLLTLATLLIIAFGVLARNGYGRSLALGGVTGSARRSFSAPSPSRPSTPLPWARSWPWDWRFSATAGRLRQLTGPFRPPCGCCCVFLIWSFLVTLLAPILFDGMTVFAPSPDRPLLTSAVLTV